MLDKRRIGTLDSLRGIAALFVFWIHSTEYIVKADYSGRHSEAMDTIVHLFDVGRVGVVLFFLLSGYLIAQSLHSDDWRTRFPIKRFFRIYPLFFASILVAWAASGFNVKAETLLANLTMLPSLFGQPELIQLYWTLETEVLFYLLIYGFKVSKQADRKQGFFWAVIFLTALFSVSQLALAESTLKEMPLLFKKLPQHLGIMLFGAHLSTRNKGTRLTAETIILLVVVLIPSSYTGIEYMKNRFDGDPPMMLSYATAILLFIVCLRFQPTSRITERIGTISYSLYLSHLFVIMYCTPFLAGYNIAVSLGAMLAVTLLISELGYRYIELPAIRLPKRLLRHARSRT